MKITKNKIIIIVIILLFGLSSNWIKCHHYRRTHMLSTLQLGSWLVTVKDNFNPQRFQIIAYHQPINDPLFKGKGKICIGRCVGLPGDKIKITKKYSDVIVNNKIYNNNKTIYRYRIEFPKNVNLHITNKGLLKIKNGSIEKSIQLNAHYNSIYNVNDYENKIQQSVIWLTKEEYKRFQKLPFITKIWLEKHPLYGGYFEKSYYFNRVLEKGVTIPQKGIPIKLNMDNIKIYFRLIKIHENNDIQLKNGNIIINGKKTNSYTPKMNYYILIDDNRYYSHDSRVWGFLPKNLIYGKVYFTGVVYPYKLF